MNITISHLHTLIHARVAHIIDKTVSQAIVDRQIDKHDSPADSDIAYALTHKSLTLFFLAYLEDAVMLYVGDEKNFEQVRRVIQSQASVEEGVNYLVDEISSDLNDFTFIEAYQSPYNTEQTSEMEDTFYRLFANVLEG